MIHPLALAGELRRLRPAVPVATKCVECGRSLPFKPDEECSHVVCANRKTLTAAPPSRSEDDDADSQ